MSYGVAIFPTDSSISPAGAQRVVFALPPAGKDKVLPLLDRYRERVEQLG